MPTNHFLDNLVLIVLAVWPAAWIPPRLGGDERGYAQFILLLVIIIVLVIIVFFLVGFILGR